MRFVVPRPLLPFIITLLAFSAIALWREINNTIRVQREIARLEQQASELEEKNRQLKSLVEYLTSSTYQERAAREQLNLQLPGEVTVAIPNLSVNSSKEQNINPEDNKSIPRAWWDYFFAPRN